MRSHTFSVIDYYLNKARRLSSEKYNDFLTESLVKRDKPGVSIVFLFFFLYLFIDY